MRPDLLERVQLAVVVLYGVLVVMVAPGHEDSRDDSQHDDDRDKSPDQHRPLFNRMNGSRYTATTSLQNLAGDGALRSAREAPTGPVAGRPRQPKRPSGGQAESRGRMS